MVKRLGLNPYRVTITAGDTQTRTTGRSWNVSKGILISTVDAMLNNGTLRFAPELLEAPALKEELANFQRTVTGTGRAQYAARTGAHDDIVLASRCAVGAREVAAVAARFIPAPSGACTNQRRNDNGFRKSPD